MTLARSLRICFVCAEYPPGPHGGIGSATQVLARGFVERGHEVRVIGVYSQSYDAPDQELDHGVRVVRLREPRGPTGWIRARVEQYRRIATWARSEQLDIIEVPDYEGWAAAWPRLRVPVVARLHSSATFLANELGKEVGATTRWLERSSLRRSDAWCAVSEYTAHKSQSLFPNLSTSGAILYNPVDVSSCVSYPFTERRDVVFAGTLCSNKGVDVLVKAWQRIHSRFPDMRLHIYGKDGTDELGRSMRAKLVEQLGATPGSAVCFHGCVSRDDVRQAFRIARLAVLPSVAESFAMTPLEAMSAGCPTVYTQNCSGPEVIEDGQTGLLVDPRDVDAVASAMTRLLEDHGLAARLGRAGQESVCERFAAPRLLAANEAFYSRCIDQANARHAESVTCAA